MAATEDVCARGVAVGVLSKHESCVADFRGFDGVVYIFVMKNF